MRRLKPRRPATAEERNFRRVRFAAGLVVTLILAGASLWPLDEASVGWAAGLQGWARGFFTTATRFGKSDWYLVPTGAIVLILLAGDWTRTDRRLAAAWTEFGSLVAYAFIAIAGAGLTTDLIKWALGRSRPMLLSSDGVFHLAPISFGYAHASLPSGHATTVAAFVVVVGLVSRRWAIVATLFAAIVAVSRVAVGAHYPSDVIAGIFVGGAYAYGLAWAMARTGFAFRRDGAGMIRPRTTALRGVLRSGGWKAPAAGLAQAFGRRRR
jgi:undecaprenyl-diphosphatase